MRFIYHHRTAGRGGEGLHITSVVRALRDRGHEVTLLSPPGVDPIAAADAVPLDKGKAPASGLTRLWKWISRSCPQPLFELLELLYNLYAIVPVWRAVRGGTPAVYYERYAFMLVAGVMVARWHGRPVLLEVNEVAGIERARRQSFVALSKWLERAVFARADEIFTVSTFLKTAILERGGRPGHVHVVPNAVDPARFAQLNRRDLLRDRLGMTNAIVLGFTGWFDRWDRLERFVDLLDQLRYETPEVRLLLVGDGPVAADIAAALKERGLAERAVLTGPVRRGDVPDYISAMDICILPDSNDFGSPIVLFEFMACAKPVVAADVPPVRDVVEHGVNGFMFTRGDWQSLRDLTCRLVVDPNLRWRLGQAARERVLRQHTWAAVAEVVEARAASYLPVRPVRTRSGENVA